MHSLPHCWTVLGAVLCSSAPLGCIQRSTPVTAQAASAPAAPTPCGGRARCSIGSQVPIDGLAGASLLRLNIAPEPGASEDEDRCRRREYWLMQPDRNLLLFADCEEQWGADSQGPALLELSGSQLRVQYVEYQSNDQCEALDALVDLAAGQVEQVERRAGSIEADHCSTEEEGEEDDPDESSSPGDGLVRPLLLLHRD